MSLSWAVTLLDAPFCLPLANAPPIRTISVPPLALLLAQGAVHAKYIRDRGAGSSSRSDGALRWPCAFHFWSWRSCLWVLHDPRFAAHTIQIITTAAVVCGATGAQEVALRRAAIETLNHGFDRFIILEAAARNTVPVVGTTPIQANRYGTVNGMVWLFVERMDLLTPPPT